MAAEAFEGAWQDLPPAFRRSMELAHESLRAGGLAVGAVLTDGSGDITGEGRNRAYDPPGGADPLQGTPLAHAEMNVLAGVPIRWDLGACTLWSTQEPCSMCAAALSFTGVGTVRFLAPDPWAIATRDRRAGREVPGTGAPGDDLWVVAANTLFLLSIVIRSGPAHKTFVRSEELEPRRPQSWPTWWPRSDRGGARRRPAPDGDACHGVGGHRLRGSRSRGSPRRFLTGRFRF